MSLPLELGLTQTDDGPRITYSPIKELQLLRINSRRFDTFTLKPGAVNPLDDLNIELAEIRVEFEPWPTGKVIFNVRDIMVEYDAKKQELSVAGHVASAPLIDGKQRLTIYCDRTGAEVFASDGLCYVPMPYNTKPENKRLFLEARDGEAKINSLEVHELKSAWPAR